MAGAARTRVMIVDDHPIWRAAVERDLTAAGFEVVACIGDGETAVRVAPAVRPDVVLMDLQLHAMTGVDATAHIVRADPSVRVLMLSSSGEDSDVLAAAQAGARGYLVKSTPADGLVDAVRRTAEGEAIFSPGLAALVLGEYQRMLSETTEQRPAPDRTRDGDLEVGREGAHREAGCRSVGRLTPHSPEPRPEHAAKASTSQQGRTHQMGDRDGHERVKANRCDVVDRIEHMYS